MPGSTLLLESVSKSTQTGCTGGTGLSQSGWGVTGVNLSKCQAEAVQPVIMSVYLKRLMLRISVFFFVDFSFFLEGGGG